MKVRDLLKIKEIKILNNIGFDNDIDNFYASDLLSFVMGHANKDNTCLLTIMSSINVIGVAVLLDLKAVIFCSNVILKEDVISKATIENIPLLVTSLDTLGIYKEILKLC